MLLHFEISWKQCQNTFFRFPLALCASAASLFYGLKMGGLTEFYSWDRFGFLALTLSVPFFLGTHLLCESISKNKERTVVVKLVATLLVLAYLFTFPAQSPGLVLPRYFQLWVACIVAVPFAGFALNGNGFGMARFMLASLATSFFIVAGLFLFSALLVLGIPFLFSFGDPTLILVKWGMFLVFIPGLWIFLSGIPTLSETDSPVTGNNILLGLAAVATLLLIIGLYRFYRLPSQLIDGAIWVIALWAVVATLFHHLGWVKKIVWIPLSLSVCLILTSFGPWGVHSVSKFLQLRNIKQIFAKIGVLDRGRKLQNEKISFLQRRQLSKRLEQFHRHFGVGDIHRLIWPDVTITSRTPASYFDSSESRWVTRRTMGLLGLKYASAWDRGGDEYFSFTVNYPASYDTSQYDVVSRLEVFNIYDDNSKFHEFVWEGKTIRINWNEDEGNVQISRGDKKYISFSVKPVVERTLAYLQSHPETSNFSVPQEILSLESDNDRIKVKIYFDNVSAENKGDQVKFSHFKSDLFIKFKKL